MKAHIQKKAKNRDMKIWERMRTFMQHMSATSSDAAPLLSVLEESSDSSDFDSDLNVDDADPSPDADLDHMDYQWYFVFFLFIEFYSWTFLSFLC